MKKPSLSTGICICCGGVYYTAGPTTRFPFCNRCFAGRCCKCAKAVRDAISRPVSKVNAGGRPPGPRMPCGWGCGAELTGQEMRPHFTRCPKWPTVSDLKRRRWPLEPTGLVLTQDQCGSASPNTGYQGQKRAQPNEVKVKRGRPPGRRMACGWRCGTQLTASDMRKHFTECPKRPRTLPSGPRGVFLRLGLNPPGRLERSTACRKTELQSGPRRLPARELHASFMPLKSANRL